MCNVYVALLAICSLLTGTIAYAQMSPSVEQREAIKLDEAKRELDHPRTEFERLRKELEVQAIKVENRMSSELKDTQKEISSLNTQVSRLQASLRENIEKGARMSEYELFSIILTAVYDALTFLLLVFVVYEAIVKPKIPNIVLFMQTLPSDTKNWGRTKQLADFVLENRGVELRTLIIRSDPDYIGWSNLGNERRGSDIMAKKTSEYFKKSIPYLGRNEKIQFFWCDMEENIEVLKKPFSITLEYDNTIPIYRIFIKRHKSVFPFDFSVFEDIIWGMTNKYDIHNVAREVARIREQMEIFNKSMSSRKDPE